MYKFSNGVVVFDEETRDKYIRAGLKIVEEKKPEKKEIKDEDEKDDRVIDKKSEQRYKLHK